jgi:hypothetical protein
MPKLAFGRWFVRRQWEPGEYVKYETRCRIYRIETLRYHRVCFQEYPAPHRRKLAILQLWMVGLAGGTGNPGGIIAIPVLIYLEIYKWYLRKAYGLSTNLKKSGSFRRQERADSNAHPRFAEYLMCLFLNKEDRQKIAGDLEEEFATFILPKFGNRQAKLWYWTQALSAIAWRNPVCRWLIASGGLVAIGRWLWWKLTS